MDKTYIEKRIEEVKKSIEEARENERRAEDHAIEGQLILEAFQEKLKGL